VDQAAEPVAATEPVEQNELARRWFVGRWRQGEWRSLPERAVRPVLVVVQRVGGHNVLDVAAEDQQPVEALAAATQRSA